MNQQGLLKLATRNLSHSQTENKLGLLVRFFFLKQLVVSCFCLRRPRTSPAGGRSEAEEALEELRRSKKQTAAKTKTKPTSKISTVPKAIKDEPSNPEETTNQAPAPSTETSLPKLPAPNATSDAEDPDPEAETVAADANAIAEQAATPAAEQPAGGVTAAEATPTTTSHPPTLQPCKAEMSAGQLAQLPVNEFLDALHLGPGGPLVIDDSDDEPMGLAENPKPQLQPQLGKTPKAKASAASSSPKSQPPKQAKMAKAAAGPKAKAKPKPKTATKRATP